MHPIFPAFPSSIAFDTDGNMTTCSDGMELRDYFAGQALIAYYSDGNGTDPELSSKWCYAAADAMLKARKL